MANNPDRPDDEEIRRALEAARNSEDGQLDPRVSLILEAAISDLWRRVQLQPDTYVPSGTEFSVYNYFQIRFRDSPVAQAMVTRYWNNYRRPSSEEGKYPQSGCRS